MITVRDPHRPYVGAATAYPDIRWALAARDAELALFKFLGLKSTEFVPVLANRASTAAFALFQFLRAQLNIRDYVISPHHYETIPTAARLAGLERSAHQSVMAANTVAIQVAFGGCIPVDKKSRHYEDAAGAHVIDLAQCCHKNMLAGVPTHKRAFLLSFESSKPQGCMAGGGAVVVPRSWAKSIREFLYPPAGFGNPRTEQAMLLSLTLSDANQKRLATYYECNIWIHRHLTKMLSSDFEIVSRRGYNPTPTMCVLQPKNKQAKSKLLLAAGGEFEVKGCYNGLIAIPTYSWKVVELLAQEFEDGVDKEAYS